MTLLFQIQLTPNWKMLRFINSIERFDAIWPDVERKEQYFLEGMKSLNGSKAFLSDTAIAPDIDTLFQKLLPINFGGSEPFNELIYWYETATEIPIPVRCALFIYRLRTDQNFQQFDKWLSLKVAGMLLFQSGYTWIGWLDLTCLKKVYNLIDKVKANYTEHNERNINSWVLSCLMVMIDFQEILMLKLFKYGAGQNLTIKEKLLLYIIQHNAGIATRRIAIKLGKSEVIVRRMLAKLRALELIARYGAGPKTYHVLL